MNTRIRRESEKEQDRERMTTLLRINKYQTRRGISFMARVRAKLTTYFLHSVPNEANLLFNDVLQERSHSKVEEVDSGTDK